MVLVVVVQLVVVAAVEAAAVAPAAAKAAVVAVVAAPSVEAPTTRSSFQLGRGTSNRMPSAAAAAAAAAARCLYPYFKPIFAHRPFLRLRLHSIVDLASTNSLANFSTSDSTDFNGSITPRAAIGTRFINRGT